MADETLRRNLDSAYDPGPGFPDGLLLSRTMAMLGVESPTRTARPRALRMPRSSLSRPWALAMVAALLLIAIVASLVFGLRAFHPPAPVPGGVTTSPHSPSSIVLDPSKWLAYTTCTECNNMDEQLWLVHPDGSANHIIANTGDVGANPDFSRDGKWIAYEGALGVIDKDYEQVLVAAADGSNPHAVHVVGCTVPTCGYGRAAWSPDSKRLAVSVDFGPLQNDLPIANGIGILDLGTGKVTQLTKHPNQPSSIDVGQDLYPRWSPDGQQVVFYRERAGQDGIDETAIFIVGVDGANLRQLTPWSELAGDPDWSPDGSRIVYGTYPLGVNSVGTVESELVTIRPDGTGRTVLTKFGFGGLRGTQPRWTPDGKAIVYTKQSNGPVFTRHIWAIAADGTSDTPIVTTRLICTNPVMQP